MPIPQDVVDSTESWEKLAPEIVLARLDSTIERGLTEAEVAKRHTVYGANAVEEKRTSLVLLVLKKFWGPSAWMLETILVLSVVLGKRVDAWVVGGLLILNATISVTQEKRAQSTVETLKQRLQITTRTLRNGQWGPLAADLLVPGDIVRLRMGDLVPADVKVLVGELSVDQAALTGESNVVSKSRGDLAFAGSLVKRGESTGIVVLTGGRTYFGKTIELVQLARPKLHMEEVVGKLVRWLFVIIGSLVLLVTAMAPYHGYSLLKILPLSLVLLMSAIPVALPVMFTVSTALAAQKLSKKGVLVTRLSAAEDAATMDVLCVDKTGTITQNLLKVTLIEPEPGFSNEDLLLFACLASNESNQDTIDLALLQEAAERKIDLKSYQQLRFTPFSPESRRTEALVSGPRGQFQVMKGAVRTLLQLAPVPPEREEAINHALSEAAAKGYRTLGIARAVSKDSHLAFAGLLSLYDAPREDSKSLIQHLGSLGVEVKMLTGDARPVAREIAKEVGLGEVISMADFRTPSSANKASVSEAVLHASGIAEVFPEDKFAVIGALQTRGHVVGMTGDGVNDAPALQAAEVGIAVSTATDAAKSAASVVLTAEGLGGIVDLVENGRAVYQRILTWVINKISRTVLKSGFVVVAFLLTGKFVISALAMLVLVFMTDFVKIALATDRVVPSAKPDSWRIGRHIALGIAVGFAMLIEALVVLKVTMRTFAIPAGSPLVNALSFQILLFLAIFSLISIRERGSLLRSRPSATLTAALCADAFLGITIGLAGWLDMPRISWTVILLVLCSSMFACLVLNEGLKRLILRAPIKV
ncbi:MAG: plasma-membrane proton-efflux P-type ATPase [Acidobacteriia bacterium]|nr:plasma-membrane proton-efflux P-type ATPase [Terriglobia bacterium]